MHPIHGIYALCDNTRTPALLHHELAQQLLEGGIQILQLRMKGERDPEKVRQTAQSILQLKSRFNFTFILNDFVDIAAELKVDGIHIGKDDGSIVNARLKVGGDCLIGYSAHSLEEALEAERQGADYVALGAIFPTTSKGPGHPVQGLEKLREVVKAVKIPVVAIGGIGRRNFSEVVSTGVDAVAMISALTCAKNVKDETRWFVEKIALKGQNSISPGQRPGLRKRI